MADHYLTMAVQILIIATHHGKPAHGELITST